ncbi:carbohydrate-binding module family 18 protein [Xylaria nigripes]|nr:carbohydrate-binding module family 18 protein [Xylaria nigripes]
MRPPSLSALANALAFASLASHAQAFRNVLYIDAWHPNVTTSQHNTADVTHVIMAFVDPLNFTTKDNLPAPPLMPVDGIRKIFNNGTKVGIALGGWGPWSTNFALVAAKENRTGFATNLAGWMKDHDYDFVDIDWEYPGGNGAEKAANPDQEITDFPYLIGEIKDQLKKQAVGSQNISLSVAGTTVGMAAFQSANQTRPIWDNVEFITVMAYDYVNRVSNATGHHTDVEGTKAAVKRYLDLGINPEQINLGFAFYAKYFQVNGTCDSSMLPIGCPIMLAQSENGTDLYTSGVLTYEFNNMNRDAFEIGKLQESPDGTCGWNNGTLTNNKCKEPYCCAESGFCGDTPQHCLPNCQINYGQCHGPDVIASYEKANIFAQVDNTNGGVWYLDETTNPNIFWTWDSPDMMLRKFNQIVNNPNATLGGVSGWSMGEDSASFGHVGLLRDMAHKMNFANRTSFYA